MLTPTDIKNIRNFKTLKLTHQRTFKHRLTKKCNSALKDIKFILLDIENMPFKINKLDVNLIFDIIELYENLSLLQNM